MVRCSCMRNGGLVLTGVLCLLLSGPRVRGQGPPPARPRTLVLTLGEAVELAIRNNVGLRAALLDEEIARERIREALGVDDPVLFGDLQGGESETLFAAEFPLNPSDPMSPSVTRIISNKSRQGNLVFGLRGLVPTGLSYQLTFSTQYASYENAGTLNPIIRNTSELTFTQPLLRAAWRAYHDGPIEIARLDSLAARQDYRAIARDRIREVELAYYDLVFTRADLDVRRQSLGLAERQVELTEVRVETGALPRIETTSAVRDWSTLNS